MGSSWFSFQAQNKTEFSVVTVLPSAHPSLLDSQSQPVSRHHPDKEILLCSSSSTVTLVKVLGAVDRQKGKVLN